jgi:hypothetical protein
MLYVGRSFFFFFGSFCWLDGFVGKLEMPHARVFICFWGAPPTKLVAWPPIGIDCVFLMAGAFHFLTYWLEKFLLFPLVGVIKICRQSKIICWNMHFNFFLEAGDATCPGIHLFMGRPPTMMVAWPPKSSYILEYVEVVLLLKTKFDVVFNLEK